MRLQPDPFLPRDLPGLVRQLSALWRALATWTRTLGVDDLADGDVLVWSAADGQFQPGTKQDTITDSGWLALTLTNGWATAGGSYSTPAYRLVNDRVYLRGNFTGGTVTDGTAIFTLPAGYRPPGQERFPLSTSATQPARVVISALGVATIYGVAAASNIGVSGITFSTT